MQVFLFSIAYLEKSVLQPRAVRRKPYLIFAGEDFSRDYYIQKEAFSKLQNKKSGEKKNKNKARVLAEIKRTSALI